MHCQNKNALVGVIDLKHGRAVHAVAGERDDYQNVSLPEHADSSDVRPDGNPASLAQHYERLGLNRLYIADLDSICSGSPQTDVLQDLVHQNHWQEILIDVGWRERSPAIASSTQGLVDANAKVGIILATETSSDASALHALSTHIAADRVLLGMDYRQGAFIGGQSTESEWIRTAIDLGIHRIVALDVATVGTGQVHNAVELCQRLSRRIPNATIYSGGGVKSDADVKRLIESGCQGCLVATWLHKIRSDASLHP